MKEKVRVTSIDQELVEYIKVFAKDVNDPLIGLDGFMNSGKTFLAMKMASLLSGFRISLDSYLDPGSEEELYINKLRLSYLKEDVEKIKNKFGGVVVEGICLIDVLSAIGEKPDILVYVKRISEQGLWHDGFHLEDYVTNKDIKENQKGLHKSEFEYHVKRKPHEIANYVFERVEIN